MSESLKQLARNCRLASRAVAQLTTQQKNKAIHAMADQILANAETIISENSKDVAAGKEKGLSDAMIDRLVINQERLTKMADALRDVAALPDPVGEITKTWTRPNGIQVSYQRIPLGVIAMIYESRPNVTSDAAGLCLKAGNAVFLRGGSEAFYSNHAIAATLHKALENENIPKEAITLVPTTDREAINEMLTFVDDIDIVIPRGGEGLIRFVAENSRIPVIKHYKGVCHQYVDKDADVETAVRLLIDGKCSRPGVCNALETLLVHRDAAPVFLPVVAAALRKKGVEIRGCQHTRSFIPEATPATDEDYFAEYLSLVLAINVVDTMDEAIQHIAKYGSDHTEVIVTKNYNNAKEFLRRVNSSVVLVNASSRFSDGGELGLGAEIGISTTKLHAFGPMGLESLTTQKFIVHGDGQTRHNLDI
jgi:glutamate-5-semialdehyde dehydrogenase